MNAHLIERHFAKIGARAKVHPETRRDRTGVTIDIGHDGEGEFFDIALAQPRLADVRVVDTQPRIRHLLLMSEQEDGKQKSKFLCGHDERHWFVAAVPERASVSNVKTAFEALKPETVRQREDRLKVKSRKRNRRRNEAFIRQGEWFFVPVPDWLRVDERLIFRNEPIARGGGKPHMCEELVRQGGELVYVSPQHPQGLTEAAASPADQPQPEAAKPAVGRAASQPAGIRSRKGAPRRSQDDCPGRLAPGADEHRDTVGGHAARGVY